MSRHTRSSDDREDYPLRPVQFSRLTRRGVMLGLSVPQVVILAVGILTIVGALYAGGGMLLAWTAPIWLVCAVLAWVPAGGRKLIEWVPIVARWVWRVTGGKLRRALGEATRLVDDDAVAFRAAAIAALARHRKAPADLTALKAAQAALGARRAAHPDTRDGLEVWRAMGLPRPEAVPMLAADTFNQQLDQLATEA